MLSTHRMRSRLAVGLVAFGVAGCGQLRPLSAEDLYEASLSGGQEAPPIATRGHGMAQVQLNTATNVITWKITYSDLTGPVTGAHIHGPAKMGQNAGIAVPFGGHLNAEPFTGQQRLAPAQVAQLLNEQWYVNIHTARHPGGEIRGQLLPRR